MIAETEIRLPADAYDDATERTNRLARRLGVAVEKRAAACSYRAISSCASGCSSLRG